MHILYISQHFPPETGAAQGRAYEMARHLVRLGNKVTVITGFPNYPEGVIPKEYRKKIYQRDEMDGINVIRTFLVPDTKESKIIRLLNYLTFLISSFIGGLFVRDVDVVHATSPPLPVGLSGYCLSLFKRADFSLEIRDLWVDFAIHLGQLNNKFVIGFVRRLEYFLYRRADKIITVTRGFKGELIDRGIARDKLHVITNGVDSDVFRPGPKDNWVREEYNLQNKFVIMYAGNVGTAQGLDFIIDTAEMTREKRDIVYVIIGSGVKKEELQQRTEHKNLENIIFIPNQPKEDIPSFLSAADLLLISL